MPNEPLLTRKSYKEQLERQQRELEAVELDLKRREALTKDELGMNVEVDTVTTQVQRTPKSGLRKYNHFLNVWVGVATIFLIIIFLIQYFF